MKWSTISVENGILEGEDMKYLMCTCAAMAVFIGHNAIAQEKTDDAQSNILVNKPNWALVTRSSRADGLASSEQLSQAVKAKRLGDAKSPDKDPAPKDERTKAYALTDRYDDFVARSRAINIPVLIPQSALSAEATSLATDDAYYAFSAMYDGGKIVSVSGTCRGLALADDDPLIEILDADRRQQNSLSGLNAPYSVTKAEVGYELTFTTFNCSYKITQSCRIGACGDEQELVEIAENLGVLNAR